MSGILGYFSSDKDLDLLNWLDWTIVIVYFVLILALGVSTFWHASKNTKHFFWAAEKTHGGY